MNSSSQSLKVYSLLQSESNIPVTESLDNYFRSPSAKIAPDLLELAWNRTNHGMLLTDSDGVIVAVNGALCSLFGAIEADVMGFPFSTLCDQTFEGTTFLEEYNGRLRQGNQSAPWEKTLHLLSGKNISVEITTSSLVDRAGEEFVLTEFRNISKRKQWEHSLRQSEIRYRSLFENSVLPMYQSNTDGKFLNANVALLQLLGYDSFDELLRLDLEHDVYLNPDQRRLFFERVNNEKHETPLEIDLKKKDGSTITVLAHSRALKDDHGVIIGFEGALENITERKTLEAQINANMKKLETAHEDLTKLNAQKDKILAIVSHDLRSPFGSILGFCDLLKTEFHTLSDKEKQEYVGYINDAAVQQLNLVNALLDWSRLESGRVRLAFTPVNMGTIASDVQISLLGLAKKKNIELRSLIPSNVVINADEQLMRQLLSNLVGNALKFTPAKGTISIGVKENSDTQLVLEITDTGTGIPEQDLKKLFKVEEKYTRRGLQGEIGTGLGLSMCYEIMKKHDGVIEAISQEGKGTTITLTFPKRGSSACRKILIVDDQKGNRMILSRFMKRIMENSEIFFAETGSEALTLVQKELPDLIITDYHMPVMDGLELIRKIREDDRMKRTPVIVISGDTMEYYVQSDGLIKILQKPVMFNQLKAIVEKIKF